MMRRDARLKKQFLYINGLKQAEKNTFHRKCTVHRAVKKDSNKTWHDSNSESNICAYSKEIFHDEFVQDSGREPKVLLTTSRNPSTCLTHFAKELKLVVPNSIRINRGGHVIQDIVQIARSHGFSDLVLAHENRGTPNCLIVCHLPYGPTAYFELLNVIMRHDIASKNELGKTSNVHPHLIFDGFNSALNIRIKCILQHLFPLAKATGKRTIAFINQYEQISFRHHVYRSTNSLDTLQLTEIGPRLDLKLYQIRLGIIGPLKGDLEWVIKSTRRNAQQLEHTHTK